MALDYAGVTTDQIAAHLDVSRSTISRWCNDHGAAPKRIYLDAIAHHCGVDADWLKTGTDPTGPDGGGVQGDQAFRRRGCNADTPAATLLKFPESLARAS